MSKGTQRIEDGSALDLSHMRREVRTALELAVVAFAPDELVARLASSAGLLEALVELPSNSPPVIALLPKLANETRRSLEEWQAWHGAYLERKMPRG